MQNRAIKMTGLIRKMAIGAQHSKTYETQLKKKTKMGT